MMKAARVVLVLLIVLYVLLGFAVNNLWRVMGDFNQLDTIISMPIVTQVLLSVLVVAVGLMCILKRGNRIAPVGLLILALFSMPSWYCVNVSNSVNSVKFGWAPFFNREVKFDSIKSIEKENGKFVIKTNSDSYVVYWGIWPMKLDIEKLSFALMGYGNCIEMATTGCRKIEFSWP